MKTIYRSFALLMTMLVLGSSCSTLSYDEHEYYEYRVYKVSSADKQKSVLSFLEKAYVPALKRMGLSRIGVFKNAKNSQDYDVHMVIPFTGLAQYTQRSDYLINDISFRDDAKSFFAISKADPAYSRVDSSFFKSFSSIPFIELPKESINKKKRVFELRVYESHNDEKAALKRDMFNVDHETQLMRDLGMDPVFFGECLSGKNYPNLTYMLSAGSLEENKKYWQTFINSPRWAKMKSIEKYKGTVSKIEKIFLIPTPFSDI
ncbi:MAG: NIPSNAP family protein [Lentisphaeraceae bacterium]|nr:NIPSNAP family protein [Lentisphaeraceae bacterium]